MFNLKFESCVVHARARTSNEMKISIEATRLACPETKDETHFLPLPLFVPIAEFDPADQCVRSGMSVRTEMLCDGKTRHILVDALEVFTKTFPQSAPSLADVNRDLKHHDGSHDDGIPEAHFLFQSCAETEYLLAIRHRAHVHDATFTVLT